MKLFIFPSDFDGKVDFVRLLMREYRLEADECAFVGDGVNDVPIASVVGTAVAYNGHPALRAAAQHSITDFGELLAIV